MSFEFCLDGRELAATHGDRLAISYRATSPGPATGAAFRILDKPGGTVLITATGDEITCRSSVGLIEGEIYISSARMRAAAVGYHAYELIVTVAIDEDHYEDYVVGSGRFRVEDDHLPRAFLGSQSPLFSLCRRDLEVRRGTALTIRVEAVAGVATMPVQLTVRRTNGTWTEAVPASRDGSVYTMTVPAEETQALPVGRCCYLVLAFGSEPDAADYCTIAKGILWVRD